jgi:hypothetical protein
MERKQQMVLDSLRRVQGYLDTHADVVGPLKDTEARKQLDQAVNAAAATRVTRCRAPRWSCTSKCGCE